MGIWLEATEEEQGIYGTMKEKIIAKMVPMAFVSLQEFSQPQTVTGQNDSSLPVQVKATSGTGNGGISK